MTTYTVVSGDNLWKIAAKYGIGVNELLAVNPQIVNPALIFPGQKINIPGTSTNKSTYTVIPGDTMWEIAQKHGIELNELLASNPQIKNPTLIFPGQIINIPSITSVPSTPGTPSTPSAPGVPTDIRELETEVIRLVNTERAKAGRSALTENNELSRVARLKSNDFVKNNYFSHTSPTYGSPFDMLKSNGIKFTAAAENIASGPKTAAEVMKIWMNSSGHKANILNSAYNQIGVGVVKDKSGKTLWTQMFIRG